MGIGVIAKTHDLNRAFVNRAVGLYKDKLVMHGDEFEIDKPEDFSVNWMTLNDSKWVPKLDKDGKQTGIKRARKDIYAHIPVDEPEKKKEEEKEEDLEE